MNSYRNGRLEGDESSVNTVELFDKFIFQLKRFWVIPVILAVVLTSVNCIKEKADYSPRYKAYITFIINIENDYDNYYSSVAAENLEETFPYIVTSDVLQKIVAEDLSLSYVPGSITAETTEGTGLFTINAEASEAQMAYDILQSVVKNYPQVADFVLGNTELIVLDESGVPIEPINSANYSYAAVRGAVSGVAVGLAVILFLAFTRQTVCSKNELKELLSVSCIGIIPNASYKQHRSKINEKPVITNKHIQQGYVEAYRNLRTRVEQAAEKGAKIFLVTSAFAGEGKTVVAANLAVALSQIGKKVILVDCNLHNPGVHALFSLKNDIGITELLNGKATMKKALQHIENTSALAIAGENINDNPYDYFGTENFSDFLEKLKNYADYIIIDSPSCKTYDDSFVISRCADEIIYVVRWNFAGKSDIAECAERLVETNGKLLGCVLNASAGIISNYRYGYGYGYGKSKYYGVKRFE